jgi:hypothetical protein
VRRLLPGAAWLVLAAAAGADTVVLTSGRVLEVEQAWFEGNELRYRQKGGVFSVPRALVARVSPRDGGPLVDPDVTRSRERLSAGDAAEALRHARLALFREPSSVPALQALAAAQLALGDATRARETAERALRLEPGEARSLELLGDALAEEGDFAGARERYRLSAAAADEPRVRRKLEALGEQPASVSSARFRIRYDGAADEPLGLAVLRALDAAWEEFEGRLGFAPGFPVTVVLETESAFRDTTRGPGWAAGLWDGSIRVPVAGLDHPTPELLRVLRHELAHSFVAARAGERCPTWVHEGIAQWLEGGDPRREDVSLARRSRAAPLPRLSALEAPFVSMDEKDATVAYAQSLSLVAHLVRRGGEAGIRRLLAALGEGRSGPEALGEAYAVDYASLQREWEAGLRAKRSESGPVSRILSPPRGGWRSFL